MYRYTDIQVMECGHKGPGVKEYGNTAFDSTQCFFQVRVGQIVHHVEVMCPAFCSALSMSPCPRLELRHKKNQLGLQTDPLEVFCHFIVHLVCSLWIHASYTNI